MSRKWKIIFSVEENDGKYRIIYDEELDSKEIAHKLPGALYLVMTKYPELIEEVILAATQAAEELSKPFDQLLHEGPTKD